MNNLKKKNMLQSKEEGEGEKKRRKKPFLLKYRSSSIYIMITATFSILVGVSSSI